MGSCYEEALFQVKDRNDACSETELKFTKNRGKHSVRVVSLGFLVLFCCSINALNKNPLNLQTSAAIIS